MHQCLSTVTIAALDRLSYKCCHPQMRAALSPCGVHTARKSTFASGSLALKQTSATRGPAARRSLAVSAKVSPT